MIEEGCIVQQPTLVLAERLAARSKLAVREAFAGAKVEPSSVWIPICYRPSEPLVYAEDAGSDQPAGPPAAPDGSEPHSFLYAPTAHDWLLGRMRSLADLFDTDQFYDGYMEQYKEEHGCFPKDSARTYARITDRCRRRILAERPPKP